MDEVMGRRKVGGVTKEGGVTEKAPWGETPLPFSAPFTPGRNAGVGLAGLDAACDWIRAEQWDGSDVSGRIIE